MGTSRIHLGALALAPGAHQAAWRHRDCDPAGHRDVAFFPHVARTAERGKLDFLFLADLLGPIGADHHSPQAFENTPYGVLEPLTLLAALSTCTEHLGLVATSSTTVNSPYQLARIFGSLDHLSHGRAGWNVVTTPLAVERRVGVTPPRTKEELYGHAREVVDGVLAYWDTWHEKSFPRDRGQGRFVSLDGSRIPDRQGRAYRIDGPLNMPRPPQGRPVIVRAGVSDSGRGLAAEIADVVFTVQPDLAAAKAFYKDIKDRADRAGRDPDTVRVLPGMSPFVAATEREARAGRQLMLDGLDPVVAIGEIRFLTDMDLGPYDLDGPIPDLTPTGDARHSGFLDAVRLIRENNPKMTVRGLLGALSSGRGHPEVTGSPADVADFVEAWVDDEACDGLVIQNPLLPDDLELFVDLVVPELQRRGRFRTAYEAATLRGNLGLAAPVR
ncbi:NtaA/DmoA family FMN-dependent monooxygenase [Streptomyces sp. NPDC005811]|uniref:NtaA/DmoA family FMN-dependent monooxygenase n=1 Tax=Streptomyces sp. NPDC005811 TaxID=3154565 RepID=UPI0033E36B8E